MLSSSIFHWLRYFFGWDIVNLARMIFVSKIFVTKSHIWLGWFSCQIFSPVNFPLFSTWFTFRISPHDLLWGFFSSMWFLFKKQETTFYQCFITDFTTFFFLFHRFAEIQEFFIYFFIFHVEFLLFTLRMFRLFFYFWKMTNCQNVHFLHFAHLV